MSSVEIMPTGRPVLGETTTTCAVSCSAISCAARSSVSFGSMTTTSVPASSPAVDVLEAGAQRAHQVEVGDDARRVAFAAAVAMLDPRDDDAVDGPPGHRGGERADVRVGRTLVSSVSGSSVRPYGGGPRMPSLANPARRAADDRPA